MSSSFTLTLGILVVWTGFVPNGGYYMKESEGKLFSIRCDEGQIINVKCAEYKTLASDNWGSSDFDKSDASNTSSETSTSSFISQCEDMPEDGCRSANSIGKVQSLCNGQPSCDIMVTDNLFGGDPCRGLNYLQVKYTCKRNSASSSNQNQSSSPKLKKICENESMNLICSSGETIMVSSAMYRQEGAGKICSDDHRNIHRENCSDIDVTDIVTPYCNNKVCRISDINDDVFGNPCSVNLKSRLEVHFSCEDETDPSLYSYESFDLHSGNTTMEMMPTTTVTTDSMGTDGKNADNICMNGGTYEMQGMKQKCKCRAGFTGNKCQTGICPNEEGSAAAGSWSKTVVGSVGQSSKRCPVDTVGRYKGKFSRICTFDSDIGGKWEDEKKTDCGAQETPGLDDLFNTPVTEENAEDVADALSNAIKDSIQKSDDIDVKDIQKVLTNIVNVESPSPNVTEGVIKAVDSVLSANISKNDQDSANASSEILRSVEKQVSFTIKGYGNFSSVKPNIAVESVAVTESQVTGGIGFSISQTTEGFEEESSQSFDPDDMKTNDEISGSFIQLPKDALFENGQNNGAKISCIAYNDKKLFQSQTLDELNATVVVGPIISAVVHGKDVVNLTKPVIVHIAATQSKEALPEAVLNTSKCVYWDFSKRYGIGDWAEDGCKLMSTESGKITCHCNHLTNFAVLVDFSGQLGQRAEPGTLNFALDIISKVGCSLSIVGLCLTLMIFLCCRGLRISLQRKILIQFCISMLGLYLTFLIGIDSTNSKSGCIIAAALLHYFVVTTVLWMGVEARHMYITLVSESDRVGRKFMIKASCFAWGVGLIPVVLVLAIKQNNYLAPAYCFIAADNGLFFGLLLPIGLVLLHNTITFGLVARKLLRSRTYVLKSDLENLENETDGEVGQKTGTAEISQRLLNAFAVSILLGMTWVFAFLAIEEARIVFQVFFCICNSFQGVLIFILFCYAQKDVRKIIFATCFTEAPSQPKMKQMKKPAATGATSVSSDTRLTGESYTEDNDTLVTNINGITMTVLESEVEDNREEDITDKVPIKTDPKELSTSEKLSDREEANASEDEVVPSDQKHAVTSDKKESPFPNKKHVSNSEPVTELTNVSADSATDSK